MYANCLIYYAHILHDGLSNELYIVKTVKPCEIKIVANSQRLEMISISPFDSMTKWIIVKC